MSPFFEESFFERNLGKILLGCVLVLVGIIAWAIYKTATTPCTYSESVAGPDGKQATLITCCSPSACVRGASDICGSNGYLLFASDGETTESTAYVQSGKVLIPAQSSSYSGTMLVRCKTVGP